MKDFLSMALGLIREEDGATAVEYGVLIAAIAVTVVFIVIIVGQQIDDALSRVCTALAQINGSPATGCQ